MSTTTGPRGVSTVRLDARGHGELHLNGSVVVLQEVDLAAARTEALRQVAAAAAADGPARLVAIDPSGQRELLVFADGRVVPAPAPPSAPRPVKGSTGRGRSSLPAADALRVPDREDTDPTPTGSPLGSPADVSTAPSVSSPHLPATMADPINPGADAAPTAVVAPRRARRGAPVIGAVMVAAIGLGAVGTSWVHERSAQDTHTSAAARQVAAANAAQGALNAKAEAAVAAAAKAVTDATHTRIQGALDAAAQVLAASDGRVADNAVRDELAAAIAQTTTTLATPDQGAWARGEQRVAAAVAAVSAAQSDWEHAAAERLGAEQAAQQAAAEAAARAATKPAATTKPQKAETPSAPAQAPAAQAPASEGRVTAIVANLSSGTATASISVRVTTSGQVSVNVTATIAGQSVSLAGPGTVAGTGTYTGTASGLPAGVQSWTASANGISTSGSIEVF